MKGTELQRCPERGVPQETAPGRPWTSSTDRCCGLPTILQAAESGDRYELLERIAEGGMSSVHAAWDTRMRRRVALKLCREPCLDLPEGCLRRDGAQLGSSFVLEMQILSQLHHPSIIPLYDFGRDDHGRLFYTMPLVSDLTLLDLIRKVHSEGSRWTMSRALTHLIRVCEALRYAHSKDVLHCDLTPANIAIGPMGQTYVLDWGLARVGSRSSSATPSPRTDASISSLCLARLRRRRSDEGGQADPFIIAGTPAYMPLEQIIGGLEWCSPRSDVYAFGAILYHLLTGAPPYAPESLDPRQMMMEVLDGPPEPLQASREIPLELASLCNRCMARSPVDRYPDLEAVGNELNDFLHRPLTGGFPRKQLWRRVLAWRPGFAG